MYNEELKERFIKEFSTSTARRNIAIGVFNMLEEYEKQWGSDFCTRKKDDIAPLIDEAAGLRMSSQSGRLTILKLYVRWCIANNVEGACDDIFSIEEPSLEKLKRQTVANPQHLQRYLNCICDLESEETVGCIYRCLYWLAYGGMQEKYVLNVTTSDVDLQNMVVNYDGKEYPIYREAISAFKNCVNLTQFRYKNPKYTTEKEIFKNRASGNTLLRGYSATRSVEAIRVEMARRSANPRFKTEKDKNDKSLDLQLSFFRVWLSGLFYRTYEAERAGMPVDFMAAAAQFMEGKTYKLDKGRNLLGARQRRLASEYLEDYNRWKEAYSI